MANQESLYKEECKTCHANDGFGKPKKDAPPLAGQHHEYIFQSIKMFQSKLRLHDNDDEDETFEEVSDKDISNLTAHISTLDNALIDKAGKSKFVAPDVVAKKSVIVASAPVAKPKVKADSATSTTTDTDTDTAKVTDKKESKPESMGNGLKITDITQTVAQMQLEEGVSKQDAIDAMLSKAADLNLKLVGQQHVSKELESRGVETPYLAIFQFCDPMDARTMIINNPVFASYMPCRISMVEDKEHKIWLMMLNLDMLVNSELLDAKVVDTAVRVNQSMLEIMVAGSTGDF
jgi:uncharacterized protein (DUF302 family)